jgi:hypothetical protein
MKNKTVIEIVSHLVNFYIKKKKVKKEKRMIIRVSLYKVAPSAMKNLPYERSGLS